jgi:hypothetical protein
MKLGSGRIGGHSRAIGEDGHAAPCTSFHISKACLIHQAMSESLGRTSTPNDEKSFPILYRGIYQTFRGAIPSLKVGSNDVHAYDAFFLVEEHPRQMALDSSFLLGRSIGAPIKGCLRRSASVDDRELWP